MKALILSLTALAAAPAAAQQVEVCEGRLLATVEPDGSVSAGSLETVRRHVRIGDALRLGWEVGRPGEPPIVVHWQDALFLTLFENHVFAQLGGVKQTPKLGQTQIDLGAPNEHWASLLSTKGRLVTRMPYKAEPHDQAVRSHWCLKK